MAATLRPKALLVFGVASVIALAFPPHRVEAQGFFDFLFGDYPSAPNTYNRPYGYNRVPPRIKIKGPRYYRYQPDRVSMQSLMGLAETLSSDDLSLELRHEPLVQARQYLSSVKIKTLPIIAEAIVAHYTKSPRFIWMGPSGRNAKARSALSVLKSANRYGLAARDYQLIADLPDGKAGTLQDRVHYEFELSARVLTYAMDAHRGRVDANRISGYHDIGRKTVDLIGMLGSLRTTSNVTSYLVGLHPGNSQFKSLVGQLAKLRGAIKGPEIEIDRRTFLRPGGTSPEVPNIVAAIRNRGSETLKSKHTETLSQYAGGTEYSHELAAMVQDFQDENGLAVDGVIGRNTISALVPMGRRDKITKIELALERLRWLPEDLGRRYVFINQPAFTATYVENGREPLVTRAVVGKKTNQTNFFVDKIETVEYNPYWGVPLSIIVNEMLPKLSRDPSYLDRLGYEVKTPSGRRISSYDVDWYAVATKRAVINVRQPPGQDNALGAIKILFPNKHAIYMHDTPQKHLFERDGRAFSHGCVRLERPREMAAAILGKSRDYINHRISTRSNERENLSESIPVYVAYFTAWPDANGTVRYSEDVYDRDRYLSLAIKRTEQERKASG